jgi:hypothetical protein
MQDIGYYRVEEDHYPVYVGPQAQRYRSTVYRRVEWLGQLCLVSEVRIGVVPAGQVRALERAEQGLWLLDFEVLRERGCWARLRLRQLAYQYRQRAMPTYSEAGLAALRERGYALRELWDGQDFYMVSDLLTVVDVEATAAGFRLDNLLSDVADVEPAAMRQPVCDEAVRRRLTGYFDELRGRDR